MLFATTSLVVPAGATGQDRLAVIERADGLVVVVADGAGGTSGGALAATFVVDELSAQARAAPLASLRPEEMLSGIDSALAASKHGGQSTAVVAVLTESGIVGASVGDSGALAFGADGGVTDLTALQVRKPLLGSGDAVPVRFSTAPLAGTLVVATDGLLKYAPRERLAEMAQRPDLDSIPRTLVDLVRLRSGGLPDDVGLIVVRSNTACRLSGNGDLA